MMILIGGLGTGISQSSAVRFQTTAEIKSTVCGSGDFLGQLAVHCCHGFRHALNTLRTEQLQSLCNWNGGKDKVFLAAPVMAGARL